MEERNSIIMTNAQKLALTRDRLQKLESNGKNVKSPGTMKKLRRQIKNAEVSAQ